MLRNYDAALLSLHIWDADNVVQNDRYLVTWKSAGDIAINDYCTKANIKQTFVVDDAVMLTQKYQNNPFRMLYLWDEIARQLPHHYDKYVIIRPDGYYWTFDITTLREIVRNAGPFKTNSWIDRNNKFTEVLADHVLIVDQTHLNILSFAYTMMPKIVECRYEAGQNDDIHAMLHDCLVKELGIDAYCNDLVEAVDTAIQRDSFRPLPELDTYDYMLYKQVYCDSSAWWRRTHGNNLDGLPRAK